MVRKFCFIGHVDSGKSTAAGHLIYLTKGLTDHELDNLKKETSGFNLWSAVLDVWEEEREKSKTHAFNEIIIKDQFLLIDTPGHKNFIRSMIEGISITDNNDIIGCLVLSAAKGEFNSGWNGGQTKEDLIIAKAVGIRAIVVLVNKMDKVDWSQEIYKDIQEQSSPFIKKLGFEVVYFMPISGWEGTLLVDRNNAPSWYEGPALMELIEKIQLKELKIPPILTEKWTLMKTNIELFEIENIIAPGYICVMHYGGQEWEVLIKKFKTKKFLKSFESDEAIILSEIPVERKKTRRFILRNKLSTVGWGRILETK